MECGHAANFSWKTKLLLPLKRAPYKRMGSYKRKTPIFCRKGSHLILAATSSSHYFHPLVPTATKKQLAQFCFQDMSHSSCHGKQETLSFGITEFSVPDLLRKFNLSLDNLCVLVLPYTLGVYNLQGKGQTNAMIS